MKRRLFLAASALSLLAAKKKKTDAGKPSGSSSSSGNSGGGSVFAPYEGSSASRLPPVKAAPFPAPADWRTFELALSLEAVTSPGSPSNLVFPLPLHQDTPVQPWQQVRQLRYERGGSFQSNPQPVIQLERQADDGLETLTCAWEQKSFKPPAITLTATLAVAERRLDLSRRTFAPERDDILRKNLTATPLLPVNEPARELAKRIVGRIVDPLAQAHALYDWVTGNSRFEAGAGEGSASEGREDGNIQRQMESRQYGGSAADISGLFVLLARALNIPARRVPGFSVAPSRFSPALGASSFPAALSGLMRCRAEFYVPGYYWIPVDPAGVCRVAALDEGLAQNASDLNALKRLFFGFWESNGFALNYAEGESLITLPRFTPATDYVCQLASRELTGRGAGQETARQE